MVDTSAILWSKPKNTTKAELKLQTKKQLNVCFVTLHQIWFVLKKHFDGQITNIILFWSRCSIQNKNTNKVVLIQYLRITIILIMVI